ncbi:MAG: hypothetical protein ACP5D1_13245 [Bacteroidales bacterium]
MKYFVKISLAILLLFFLGSCSSSRSYYGSRKPRKKDITIETTRLGKNKLFFSKEYQRKLKKRMKKNRR